MAGIEIIAKDREGKIKQDLSVERTAKGKQVKINKLKDEQDGR